MLEVMLLVNSLVQTTQVCIRSKFYKVRSRRLRDDRGEGASAIFPAFWRMTMTFGHPLI